MNSIKQKIPLRTLRRILHFVRLKGLEPPRREAPDPKSGVATNYTTAAFGLRCKGNPFLLICKFFSGDFTFYLPQRLFIKKFHLSCYLIDNIRITLIQLFIVILRITGVPLSCRLIR